MEIVTLRCCLNLLVDVTTVATTAATMPLATSHPCYKLRAAEVRYNQSGNVAGHCVEEGQMCSKDADRVQLAHLPQTAPCHTSDQTGRTQTAHSIDSEASARPPEVVLMQSCGCESQQTVLSTHLS